MPSRNITNREQSASTNDDDGSCENPQSVLVLASMECSFDSLQELIQQVNFDPSGTSKHLPPELSKHVANFLTVQKVVRDEVEAVGSSSMDMPHQLADCLIDDEDSWWMSGAGTMPGGRGAEYVEFRLCRRQILRRVTAVQLRIPPLPMGPLSVREFRVDVADEWGLWRQLPGIHLVDNRAGMQQFEIGNIDAHSVRVVCLSNQISTYLGGDTLSYGSVGYYAVKFC